VSYRQPRNYRKPRRRSQPSRRTKIKRGVRKGGRTAFLLFLPVIIWILAKAITAWEAGLVQ